MINGKQEEYDLCTSPSQASRCYEPWLSRWLVTTRPPLPGPTPSALSLVLTTGDIPVLHQNMVNPNCSKWLFFLFRKSALIVFKSLWCLIWSQKTSPQVDSGANVITLVGQGAEGGRLVYSACLAQRAKSHCAPGAASLSLTLFLLTPRNANIKVKSLSQPS